MQRTDTGTRREPGRPGPQAAAGMLRPDVWPADRPPEAKGGAAEGRPPEVPPPGLSEKTAVVHVRHRPFRRSLRHRGYAWFVDVDALPRLPRVLRPFARFCTVGHAGDPRGSPRANLERWPGERGVDLDGGPVRMRRPVRHAVPAARASRHTPT